MAYVGAAIVPAGLAVALLGRSGDSAWDDVQRASHARVARLTVAGFEQEIGSATYELAQSAPRAFGASPREEAVRRALAGDTVAAVGISGSEVQLSVVLADSADPATVRFGSASFAPEAPEIVGRATGYAVALYLGGQRWRATDPPPEPAELSEGTQRAASASPAGAPVGGGVAVAMSAAPGAPGGEVSPILALAQPLRPTPTLVSRAVLGVVATLLAVSALAGWIRARRPDASGRWRRHFLLLAVIPVATVLMFARHTDARLETEARALLARDLGRSLAVARALELVASPEALRAISGFHAARVRPGSVEASTFPQPPEALATLPTPPPSFGISGEMSTSEGRLLYVATRLDDGAAAVVAGPLDPAFHSAARTRAAVILAGFALWLLAGGYLAGNLRGDS